MFGDLLQKRLGSGTLRVCVPCSLLVVIAVGCSGSPCLRASSVMQPEVGSLVAVLATKGNLDEVASTRAVAHPCPF